jgi:hypothetical protein
MTVTARAKPRTRARTAAKRPKLRDLSDVRRYFLTDPTPTYFVSATPFNLLGLHDWVGGFQYVNYIDCFDGDHGRIVVPAELPHEQFESIEDINNYLLGHKEVADLVARRGKGRAVFLMFDGETEELAQELGLDVWFPKASLRQEVDNKVIATRIGEKAGVHSVPNVLGKVESWAALKKLAKPLGDDLVVQTAFGDSGHTTFFISKEEDYKKHADEIAREPEVKVMRRIRCVQAALEACVTRHGTLVAPLMSEVVGVKELTPYRGGWCGNELRNDLFSPKLRAAARSAARAFGNELGRRGYRGYFELDFLIDEDTGKLYLGEVNPRITGASLLTNISAFGHADAPLFMFHLLEWSGVDWELDVDELSERWARPESIDTWGQLVMKHTNDSIDRVTRAPATGLWRMDRDGGVSFVRSEQHPRACRGPDEAFWLRISGAGDYRYEGADLGILLTPAPLLENGKLTERARAWIRGIKAQYAGEPLAKHEEPVQQSFAKQGRFKIF